jgi:uncharacterized protein (TIGR02058 family)
MTLRRCLLELGTGVDLHGKDSTKAARRAVADALRHSSVAFPRVFGYDSQMMFVEVNVAVPNHESVRPGEVLLEVPYGRKSINVVEGGLELPDGGQSDDSTIMANAAIVVSLDVRE